jgi:Mg-chelatase subunit ChlD
MSTLSRAILSFTAVATLGCAAAPAQPRSQPASPPVASSTAKAPAPSAPEKPVEAYQPIGVVLILDRSGSMTGEKFEQTKRAAIATIRALNPKDRFSVVVFDSAADVLVELGEASRPGIAETIQKVNVGGGTNILPGLEAAEKMIAKDDLRYHIVLMTDGQARDGLIELVRSLRERKVSLSTVALGQEADRELLEKLAEAGGGTFHDVTLPNQLETVFVQEAQNGPR